MSQSTFLTDRVRILIFFKKNHSLSDDEFKRYWLEEHSLAFKKFIEGKTGLIKCTSTNKSCRGSNRWVTSTCWKTMTIWTSAEYFSDVVPVEEKFYDRKSAIIVRLNIVPMMDRSNEFPTPARTETSPLLREDRVRMVCALQRKQGMTMDEMTKYWSGGHISATSGTRLVKEIITGEQNHLVFPNPIVSLDKSVNMPLPTWDGFTLVDTPSLDTFLYPEDAKTMTEDRAKFLDELLNF
ncbi:hypothetical protein VNI00_004475 [Paramarasmius palmivorus]|uniref:EthD domain-containing protein n=1 Tax=Paramarasmius palmivorus TaxID=297713 RepID=A0AAW0DKQ6_9AGAR